MDIVGIVLLYCYGAIGGKWIDAPTSTGRWMFTSSDDPEQDLRVRARNERRARLGSGLGLLLAVTGFGLQIYAQWL